MQRLQYIEQFRRQIYGGFPQDDAEITVNLVNQWLNQAIGVAARANYKDALTIDGIGYVNNSFYTRFSGLSISSDGNFLWKMTLPQVPLGVGQTEGISTLELVDPVTRQVTRPFVPLSENQKTFYQSMMPIPNKVLYYYEGNLLYAISTLILNQYTANVTMISGGDSTDLSSNLNVPDDYIPAITEYLKQQLVFERMQPQDLVSDGNDIVKTV